MYIYIYLYLFVQFDVGFPKYLIQFCNFKGYSYICLRKRLCYMNSCTFSVFCAICSQFLCNITIYVNYS